MIKRTTIAMSLAIAGTILVPTTGSGATLQKAGSKYTGSFPSAPDSELVLKTKLKDGEPIRVLNVFMKGLPSDCTITGPGTIDTDSAGVSFGSGATVSGNRRFAKRIATEIPGSSGFVSITGRFSKNFKTVTGTLQADVHFLAAGEFPEEDCSSEVVDFKATR